MTELAISARQASLVFCLAGLIFTAVRFIHISADPPVHVEGIGASRELYGEGAFKAHEARKFALFSEFSTNAKDNYRFWLVQSPVHVVSLGIWLKMVGASWSAVKAFGIIASLLGFLALLAIALKDMSKPALVFFILASAFSYYSVIASRTGLIEITLMAVMSVALFTAWKALADWRWLFAMHWLCFATFLTKQSGLIMLGPALVVTALVGLGLWRNDKKKLLAVVGHALFLIFLAVLYVQQDDYWRTVLHNTHHLLRSPGSPSWHHFPVLTILSRYFDWQRWQSQFFFLLPGLWFLILAQFVVLICARFQGRKIGQGEWLMLLWFASIWFFLQLTPHLRFRYTIMLLAPAPLIAAQGLENLLRLMPKYKKKVFGLAAILLFFSDVLPLVNYYIAPTFQIREASDVLSKSLGSKDVLVGSSVPWLALGAPGDHFVVKNPFNCSEEKIRALGVTHLLVRRHESSLKCLGSIYTQAEDVVTEVTFRRKKFRLLKVSKI